MELAIDSTQSGQELGTNTTSNTSQNISAAAAAVSSSGGKVGRLQ